MTTGIIFYVLFGLFFKHLVIDFPLYSGYICRNQKSYESFLWGLHLVVHGIATFIILWLISVPFWVCLLFAATDMVSHAIIDYVSIYCNNRCNVDKNFESKFYWVVELDQYLHSLTYVIMTLLLVLI